MTIERQINLPPLEGYTRQIEQAEKIRNQIIEDVQALREAERSGVLWSSLKELQDKYLGNSPTRAEYLKYSEAEKSFEKALRADQYLGNKFLFKQNLPSQIYEKARARKSTDQTEKERVKQEIAAAKKALESQSKAYYWLHL